MMDTLDRLAIGLVLFILGLFIYTLYQPKGKLQITCGSQQVTEYGKMYTTEVGYKIVLEDRILWIPKTCIIVKEKT